MIKYVPSSKKNVIIHPYNSSYTNENTSTYVSVGQDGSNQTKVNIYINEIFHNQNNVFLNLKKMSLT